MHRTFIHVHTVAAITCVSHNDARLPVQLRESAYIYEHKSGDVHIGYIVGSLYLVRLFMQWLNKNVNVSSIKVKTLRYSVQIIVPVMRQRIRSARGDTCRLCMQTRHIVRVVSVHPSACHVRVFCILSKGINIAFNFFALRMPHHSRFPVQNVMTIRYADGREPT